MGEKIKGFGGKVKAFFGKLSKTVKILMVLVLLAAIGVIIAVAVHNANKPYETLFTKLSSTDMQNILTYLDSAGVKDVKVQGDDTILVREGQASALQAKVLQQGYPTSGYLYSTYNDMVSMLASDSDRLQAVIYQTQDRLGYLFSQFDGVVSAAVNISLGEDNRYILSKEDKIVATAYVQVEMEPGRTLTKGEAKAIIWGTANSVQGLSVENVTLSDTTGVTYDGEEDPLTETANAVQMKMQLERKVRDLVRGNVWQVLAPAIGPENLTVTVNAIVDVNRKYIESTEYSQPDWAGEGVDGTTGSKGIINSTVWDVWLSRDGESNAGGVPGTTSNSDLMHEDLEDYITNPENLTGNETELHASGEETYDTNKKVTQEEVFGGQVLDVTVSVAIDRSKVNLTEEELAGLVETIATAATIDKEIMNDKITISYLPFWTPEEDQPTEPGVVPTEPGEFSLLDWILSLEPWILIAVGGGLLLLITLIIVICVLVHKHRKKKRLQQQQEWEQMLLQQQQETEAAIAALRQQQQEAEEQATQGADIMDIHTEKSMELRKEVRQFVEDNPEIAATMVKQWLKGGDEQHA